MTLCHRAFIIVQPLTMTNSLLAVDINTRNVMFWCKANNQLTINPKAVHFCGRTLTKNRWPLAVLVVEHSRDVCEQFYFGPEHFNCFVVCFADGEAVQSNIKETL